MPDFGAQAGQSYAKHAVHEPHSESGPMSKDAHLDEIFKQIKAGPLSTLAGFLYFLFAMPKKKDYSRTASHSSTVSYFLGGHATLTAADIVELMYLNPDGIPKRRNVRATKHRMAHLQLGEWAVNKVEGFLNREATQIAGIAGGFHLTRAQATWEHIQDFSLAQVVSVVEKDGPILLRLLSATAMTPKMHIERASILAAQNAGSEPLFAYFSRPLAFGSGSSRRDLWVIIIVACMLLLYARNMHFSVFRKVAGLWLFANSASDNIFSVLSRAGFSSSYTTVLKTLRTLSKSAQELITTKAKSRQFLLIYDNINRMQRAWNPDLGERDRMNSGTAATYIQLADCNVETAFDIKHLAASQAKQGRKKLDVNVLLKRINWAEVNKLFTLHSLSFLAQETEHLSHHRDYINLRFRTTHASHRMRKGRQTTAHPMATSDYDEGSTEGNRDVINDLLLNQLKMEKEEVGKMIVIIGGDQSTVEKIRTLKKFLEGCPHGYARYGWVLPLIQLWHMGWSDLERILSTHWGGSTSSAGDLSSFYFTNIILKRKIKDIKHPDYYPTQIFVFDNLKIEILDCWKTMLNTNDLNEYFRANTMEIEDLLKLADQLTSRYLTTQASEQVLHGRSTNFVIGSPWTAPPTASWFTPGSDSEELNKDDASESGSLFEEDPGEPDIIGDQVLANTILRMRDSMAHYEFQCSIAEGDIGRALNIMAIWTFTFTGSGRNKYSNALLELACNFEYEYSDDLQTTILNNWLCNLSGIEGCWFPMDLLQEHNIKQLKKMSQRRDAGFGSSFFKEIISFNIRAFLQVNATMKTAVRLGAKGASHQQKKKAAAMKELSMAMTEKELHKYRGGRTFDHVAADDFECGFTKLTSGNKIKDFINRTLAGSEADGSDEEDEHDPTGLEDFADNDNLPSIIIDGILLNDDAGDMENDVDDSDESSGSEI